MRAVNWRPRNMQYVIDIAGDANGVAEVMDVNPVSAHALERGAHRLVDFFVMFIALLRVRRCSNTFITVGRTAIEWRLHGLWDVHLVESDVAVCLCVVPENFNDVVRVVVEDLAWP